jgi:hypothetical protein
LTKQQQHRNKQHWNKTLPSHTYQKKTPQNIKSPTTNNLFFFFFFFFFFVLSLAPKKKRKKRAAPSSPLSTPKT